MKKYYLPLVALAFAAGSIQAQTILEEDFETGNTGKDLHPIAVGAGWTTVNSYSGDNASYTWHNYYANPNGENSSPTISGACCASVDAPLSVNPTDGGGPREEILLTPELNLNDTYQLQFTFKVSPVNSSENSRYDLQVRVVEGDNLNGAETIFSIQNEKMLRESGIGVFPIPDWAPYTAKVDLSDFKGSKVKLAFVYKMFAKSANVVWLDDVSVKKHTPPTAPMPSLTMNRYTFPTVYIGEKRYSDPITLSNIGKDGLQITSIDCPAGFGTTLNPGTVNLNTYQSVMFNIFYKADMTSAAEGKIVIHTTGGDATIDVAASKQLLPDGASLETFETYFPPAGWENNGWGWIGNALEGDHSVYQPGDFSRTTLRSPRLDLIDGGTISFTYFNSYDGDYAPEYDITLDLSIDGGTTWKTVWTSDYQNGLNKILTEEIDLGFGSDNCYVRWNYPAVETDDEGAFDHSIFYLDCVVLPKMFGADGVPTAVSKPTPAPGTTDVYPKGVTLSWAPAQFAKGYKLYLGTTSACNEVINGQDLGNALSIALPDLAYETRYCWKVIPYNDKGDANNNISTWTFTTQKDASITTFPYEQNFTESNNNLPTGWISTTSASYSRAWSVNSLKKYEHDGKSYNVAFTTWLNAGESNSMLSPDVTLPTDKPMCISFLWGDEHPASLKVDPSGMVQKNNVVPNNGVSEMTFDIYVDGAWTTLTTISENYADEDNKYWINERVDLTNYAGKKVQFRWLHKSYSGRDNGGSVTHVIIEEAKGDHAAFNRSGWNAGKVNSEKSVASGDLFTMFNLGSNELTIKSVSFTTPNFTTSLKAGDVLAAGSVNPFTVQFDALQSAGTVSDTMSVEFESGYIATLALEGEALPQGTFYFSFEPNDLDYKWDEEFTMIDADKAPNYSFSSYWIYYSADGMRGAFSCESDSKNNDGLYGMMNPVSGMHALVASSGESVNADNWIISRRLVAGNEAKFDFYARNWESLESVLPHPKHSVSVMVSTESNTKTSDFTPVLASTEMPFLHSGEWNHYEVDLSSYAGQSVYVALRHTTASPSNLAFFDDFTLSDFTIDASGIENVTAEETAGIPADARVEVYNINGVLVAAGVGPRALDSLEKGFYVVKAEGCKAFSILK